MKILVAAASPWSGLADTAMLLAEAGLKPAQPAAVGADVFQSPADWHTQLLQTLDLDPEGLNASGPLPVGKLWEDMAVGLLRANLGTADWFLADTRATWALDFWASIDPQVRFLLLYLPAEAALYNARQHALADNVDAAETWDPTPCAQAWLRHNRQLLRLTQSQPARTLLVNTQQAVLHPQRLVNTLASALGVQTATPGDLAPWDGPIYLSAPIEALVAPALAAELRALNRQLREAQTPLLSGGTQLVLAPDAQASALKAPGLLGWLGKSKQAEQALASAHTELAHTQADLGHAYDVVNALAVKKERLHRSLFQAEQVYASTQVELQQARDSAKRSAAALAQAQSELTLADAQLRQLRIELETQQAERQTQTGALTQQISKLKAQLEAATQQATSHQQAKASEVAELTRENELLLQQLHQVQEELENFFHEREALKPQLTAAEQAKAQAEKAKAETERKVADLAKQLQEAKAAKEQADKALTAAEQGKVQADKAKAEAEKKAADLASQMQEAKAAKEQADKARAAAEQGKTQAEKAKAEAEKKAADLADQVQEAKVAKEQAEKARSLAEQNCAESSQLLNNSQAAQVRDSKALQEALQENDLLLKQLHQVQEELEGYFLKHQEAQQAHAGINERLNRLLQRLPTWADAAMLSADVVVQEPDHRCLRIRAQHVWVGQEVPIAQLQFLFGVRDAVPYLEFRPGPQGVPDKLLPWPEPLADDIGPRLLLAPGAPGEMGRTQASVVAQLSATQWRLVRGLLVLVGSHVGRLGQAAQADRAVWAQATRQLTQQLEALSPSLHHEGVEVLAVTQPMPGLETVRLAVKQLSTKALRMPLLVFELGLQHKTVKGQPVPQALYLEFRQWKAARPPFVGWKPNGQDAQGPFMRLNYPLKGKNRPSPPELAHLTEEDQVMLASLQGVLSWVLVAEKLAKYTLQVPAALWATALQQLPNSRPNPCGSESDGPVVNVAREV